MVQIWIEPIKIPLFSHLYISIDSHVFASFLETCTVIFDLWHMLVHVTVNVSIFIKFYILIHTSFYKAWKWSDLVYQVEFFISSKATRFLLLAGWQITGFAGYRWILINQTSLLLQTPIVFFIIIFFDFLSYL